MLGAGRSSTMCENCWKAISNKGRITVAHAIVSSHSRASFLAAV